MSRYVQFPALAPGLAAGARDRAVCIEALTSSLDESGFPIEAWTELTPIEWMHRKDLAGGEKAAAMQVTALMDSAWVMAYRPDMDPESVDVLKTRRLVYQGRIFDIVAAAIVGRRDGIELMTLSTDRQTALATAAGLGVSIGARP
jgi:hypothetical protein